MRGGALILVLWSVALLSMLALSFSRTTRVEASLARNATEAATARLVADASARRGILALLEARAAGTLGRRDGMSGRSAVVADGPAPRRLPDSADTTPLLLDGTTYLFPFAGQETLISFEAEAGKVDLNMAPAPLLRAAFVAAGAGQGEATAYAEAVIHYREQLRQAAAQRSALNEGVAPTNAATSLAPFGAVEELFAVPGIPHDLVDQADAVFTVYSRQSSVDRDIASPALLAALGEASQVRSSKPVSSASGSASGAGGLSAFPVAQSGLGRSIYTIRAQASEAGRARFIRTIVVELTDDRVLPYHVFRWDQGRPITDANPGTQ
jgi:general secretion pathway protein K